eukprot:EG_transcript_13478
MEKYTNLRVVGHGTMGECHLVQHCEDRRLFVMKQMSLHTMTEKEQSHAVNEVRILASLAHPNVVQFQEYFYSKPKGLLCLVMEYAEGGDLASRLHSYRMAGQQLSESTVLDWFLQVGAAVDYLHERHVLHRDLKLQNIFLSATGVVKLGDFGLSRRLDTAELAKSFVGTPYYLSPEILQELPYDERSDIWALGVVLYELMAQRHPFHASDFKALIIKILRLHYEPPPPCYSEGLRQLDAMMLQGEPGLRPSARGIMGSPVVTARLAQWGQGGPDLSVPADYAADLVQRYSALGPVAPLLDPSDGAGSASEGEVSSELSEPERSPGPVKELLGRRVSALEKPRKSPQWHPLPLDLRPEVLFRDDFTFGRNSPPSSPESSPNSSSDRHSSGPQLSPLGGGPQPGAGRPGPRSPRHGPHPDDGPVFHRVTD